MTLTLTDLFCGAGGSSTGAIQVPGIEVRVASNHWQLAVDTHNTNHPDAAHICALAPRPVKRARTTSTAPRPLLMRQRRCSLSSFPMGIRWVDSRKAPHRVTGGGPDLLVLSG